MQSIPRILFEQVYIFVSYDVVPLFINVPLDRTINIMSERTY